MEFSLFPYQVNVNRGDVIVAMSSKESEVVYFIVTKDNLNAEEVEIKSLSSTYTCAKYESLEALNEDIKRGKLYNKHSNCRLRVVGVIPHDELELIRKRG